MARTRGRRPTERCGTRQPFVVTHRRCRCSRQPVLDGAGDCAGGLFVDGDVRKEMFAVPHLGGSVKPPAAPREQLFITGKHFATWRDGPVLRPPVGRWAIESAARGHAEAPFSCTPSRLTTWLDCPRAPTGYHPHRPSLRGWRRLRTPLRHVHNACAPGGSAVPAAYAGSGRTLVDRAGSARATATTRNSQTRERAPRWSGLHPCSTLTRIRSRRSPVATRTSSRALRSRRRIGGHSTRRRARHVDYRRQAP